MHDHEIRWILATIELHARWIVDPKSGERADFDSVDLAGLDLAGVDLSRARMPDVDLHDAKLIGAKLIGAKLVDADLSFADCRGADFTGADLQDANFEDADLSGSNFTGANLDGVLLRGAKLEGVIWSDGKPTATEEESEALARRIADVVLEDPETLCMATWHHHCGTKHCLAGWAEVIVDGKGSEAAEARGCQLVPTLRVFFYDQEQDAIDELRQVRDA